MKATSRRLQRDGTREGNFLVGAAGLHAAGSMQHARVRSHCDVALARLAVMFDYALLVVMSQEAHLPPSAGASAMTVCSVTHTQ